MEFTDVSWQQFKEAVTTHIGQGKRFIYRGQSNSEWPLKTKLHRTGLAQSPEDIEFYIDNIVPIAYEAVVAWESRVWDLQNPYQLAQFIAYLQHNGFPTPFLDWTYSPYVAAFFAFDGIDHYDPQYNFSSVYCFDTEAWLKAYKQSYDYRDKNMHVSIIQPSFIGNPKQMIQQGVFMYTNLVNIEGHIEHNQKGQDPFLRKYRMPVSERAVAMKEPRLMNINSLQLFPSIESVCKKVATDVSLAFPMGKTKREIEIDQLVNALLQYRDTEEKKE